MQYFLAWAAALLLWLPGAAGASTWELQVADRPNGAIDTSLALDSQDRPHISAFDWFNQVLKYTRFDGTT